MESSPPVLSKEPGTGWIINQWLKSFFFLFLNNLNVESLKIKLKKILTV
jgi:hypothetical protein